MKFKFKILFKGASYCNELYDSEGKEIFELETAILAAKELYPNCQYEIYNGNEGFSNIENN